MKNNGRIRYCVECGAVALKRCQKCGAPLCDACAPLCEICRSDEEDKEDIMFKINDNTIFDVKTGICYNLSEHREHTLASEKMARDEGIFYPVLTIFSVHGTNNIEFIKDDANKLWVYLQYLVTENKI